MSEERNNRNEVFKPQDVPPVQVPTGVRTQSISDKVKSDFGLFDIPSEIAPLPSNGVAYPVDCSLHGLDSIEIKSMTTKEEDILINKAFLKKGTVITELIRSCMVDKSFDPKDLLVGDRNAVMVAVRVTGYGADYDAELKCSECQAKTKRTFDLSALPIKRLDIRPVVEGENLFEFTLPYTKKLVKFKFLTGRDEEAALELGERQKKLGLNSDASITSNLLSSIVSIAGVTDRAKLAEFIRILPARDSLALRSYIQTHEPGIEMKQETECSACGFREEAGIPLGTSFLWPQSV